MIIVKDKWDGKVLQRQNGNNYFSFRLNICLKIFIYNNSWSKTSNETLSIKNQGDKSGIRKSTNDQLPLTIRPCWQWRIALEYSCFRWTIQYFFYKYSRDGSPVEVILNKLLCLNKCSVKVLLGDAIAEPIARITMTPCITKKMQLQSERMKKLRIITPSATIMTLYCTEVEGEMLDDPWEK